tara:strand:+ start:1013 stop:1513 length:501 start_codon:yes stop_codon:yes gene_type:complete
MAQLTIKVSAKADAMIAQLQKEIFNRRRKKVTAQGVVETLVESGAKSQSDKRYAASWKNLIKDIEKAAKVSEEHGNKPANISSEEWALILSHRTRKATATKKAPTKKRVTKTTIKASAVKKHTAKKSMVKKAATPKSSVTKRMAAATKASPRPAKRRRAIKAAATA